MSLFAIGDLHLGISIDKPMDIFGEQWKNHRQKISDNWKNNIKNVDTVLIPGDISWAMRMNEAKADLDFIDSLPGRKIFIKGNHDYWWSSVLKLNSMYKDMFFIQNTFVAYEEYAVCGSRGWDLPNENFDNTDLKTYKKELLRVRLSLDKAVEGGYKKIIFMMHYPPLYEGSRKSEFTDILNEYPVKEVIYGHLHGKDNFKRGFKGNINGCNYRLVSADYINFNPVLILS